MSDKAFYAGDFKAPDPKERSLSLEDTSEFTRPTWATPQDLPVGQDELGNTVFQGVGGRQYIAKPNPLYGQQRPKGGFVRSALGAIPPVNEWSVSGMGEAAARGAKAIGEVLWDVVDTPRATLAGEKIPTIGDAVDVAGFSATGGLASSAPEGALRIFGGSRATSPGNTRWGAEAPESVGADSLYRFEIDDSDSIFMPAYVDRVKNRSDVGDKTTTVGDVLIHDELFYQYPDLKNVKIIIDESLEGGSTSGYFSPKHNTVAFSPDRLKDPQDMKNTLIHELQHGVQEIEGFATGDNLTSLNVSRRSKDISNRRQERIKEREKTIKEKFNPEALEDHNRRVVAFYGELLEELADVPFTEATSRTNNTFSVPYEFFDEGYELDLALARLNRGFSEDIWTGQKPPAQMSREKTYTAPVRSTEDQVNEVARLYSKAYKAALKRGKTKEFFEITKLPEEPFKKFQNLAGTDYAITYLPQDLREALYKQAGVPEAPYEGPHREVFSAIQAYKEKIGEVEARNAATRRDFSLEERFNKSPESTEDVPRGFQWSDEDFRNFNKGGLVVDYTKQALGEL